MTRWSSRVSACFVAGAVSVIAACTWLAPDPDRLDRDFGRVDAGSVEDGAALPRTCTAARPPPRPAGNENPGGLSLSFVVSDLALARADAGVGFDLDESCTCPDEPSCTPPAGAGPLCDDPGGVDNGLDRIYSSIKAAEVLLSPTSLTRRLAEGRDNLLIQLESYNGEADDPSVDVYAIRSRGMPDLADGGSPRPTFDGTDPFLCTAEDVVLCGDGGVTPAGQPLRGYVASHVLAVPNVLVELALVQGFGVRVRGSLTARLVRLAGGGFRLEGGLLAGALAPSDLLQAVARAELAGNTTLCETPGALPAVRNQLCAGRDVRLLAGPKGQPCDAVSGVFTFTAVPFVASGTRPNPTTSLCDAAVPLSCD